LVGGVRAGTVGGSALARDARRAGTAAATTWRRATGDASLRAVHVVRAVRASTKRRRVQFMTPLRGTIRVDDVYVMPI